MIKGFNIMKLRFVFLAVMLMLLALPSRADLVYVFTVGDFEYQYTQYEGGRTEVGVAKYNGTSKDVTVPSSVISPSGTEHSVEYIRFDAFRECTFLESVSLPNTIKFLSNEVFQKCTSLKEITVWNPVPPEMVNGNSVFTDVPVDAVIYVPAGATKRYSEAGGWNYFHDFRELDAVSIFIPDLTISVGETKPIAVEIYTPEGISIVSKLWWSFDPSIATVDENGNVTGVSLGVCQILFMATDNNGIEYMNYGMLAVEKLSAINNISIDNNTTSGHFDIYNLQGICLKRGGTRTDIETLSPGMYIINGKKVMIR